MGIPYETRKPSMLRDLCISVKQPKLAESSKYLAGVLTVSLCDPIKLLS